LSELLQHFPPFFFANPDLKPESSTGYDLGIEQPFVGDAVRAGVTYFHTIHGR
jgi:vitamin B12 transporter